MDGEAVIDGIVNASRFAELDPYRAATHNKGIMNGIDAVVIATGNDWRAVEAGAHAFAARSRRYSPLAIWRRDGWRSRRGRLELPLALGTVGGTLRVHPAARLALRILGHRERAASSRWSLPPSASRTTSPRFARSRPTESSAGTWRSTRARSRSRRGASARSWTGSRTMIVEARDITVEAAKRALATVMSQLNAQVAAGERKERWKKRRPSSPSGPRARPSKPPSTSKARFAA